MKNRFPHGLLARAAALTLVSCVSFAPLTSHAESVIQTGTGALSSAAHVDFTVVIPKVLFFQVGTGSTLANNTTINLVSFTVPAASVGDGTAVAASVGSGDLGNGIVTAKVLGNSGAVTLSATTVGAMSNGAAATLSYGQIQSTSAVLTSATALPAPALVDGATSTSTVPAVAGIVSQDAKWSYKLANTVVPAPGTYGGINTQNGRVTYTASVP